MKNITYTFLFFALLVSVRAIAQPSMEDLMNSRYNPPLFCMQVTFEDQYITTDDERFSVTFKGLPKVIDYRIYSPDKTSLDLSFPVIQDESYLYHQVIPLDASLHCFDLSGPKSNNSALHPIVIKKRNEDSMVIFIDHDHFSFIETDLLLAPIPFQHHQIDPIVVRVKDVYYTADTTKRYPKKTISGKEFYDVTPDRWKDKEKTIKPYKQNQKTLTFPIDLKLEVFDKERVKLNTCKIALPDLDTSAYRVSYDPKRSVYHLKGNSPQKVIRIQVDAEGYTQQQRQLDLNQEVCLNFYDKVWFCMGKAGDHYVWNHCYYYSYTFNPRIIAVFVNEDSIFRRTVFFPLMEKLKLKFEPALTDSFLKASKLKNILLFSRKDGLAFDQADDKRLSALREQKWRAGPVLGNHMIMVADNVTVNLGTERLRPGLSYEQLGEEFESFLKSRKSVERFESLGTEFYQIYFKSGIGEDMIKELNAWKEQKWLLDFDTHFIFNLRF